MVASKNEITKENRTTVNETSIKRTTSRESKPTYSHSAIKQQYSLLKKIGWNVLYGTTLTDELWNSKHQPYIHTTR